MIPQFSFDNEGACYYHFAQVSINPSLGELYFQAEPGVGALTKLWFGIGKSNSDRVGWEYFGIGVEEI